MDIKILIEIYIKYCNETDLIPEYTVISDVITKNDIFFLIDIALIYCDLHNLDKKNILMYLDSII
jgi:uncharacterized protein (UPF0276 family)